MKKTYIIVIDGQNGAGKTTTARLLHQRMPFTALINWNAIRKCISDFRPTKKYHDLATKITLSMTQIYLDNGVNVIYEAYFGHRRFIYEIAKTVRGYKKTKMCVY